MLAIILQLGVPTMQQAQAAPATSAYGSVTGLRLRNAQGKPCLDYRPITRREVVVDKTFDHVIVITNACPKAIDVKLCYKNSQSSCKNLHVAGYEQRSMMLGVMYNVPVFGFDFEEAFAK